MTTSSPRGKFSVYRWQVAILLLIFCGIALLMRPSPAMVTVSGVDLSWDYARVLEKLGKPDYTEGSPPHQLEYWSDPVTEAPSLSLSFDPEGRLIRIRGGKPEINGEDARGWSLAQIESALGPADGAGKGGSVASGGLPWVRDQATLRYPDRHLLVAWSPAGGVEFFLFTGTRRP